MNPLPTTSDDLDSAEREALAWCDECARQGFALLDQMEAEADQPIPNPSPRGRGLPQDPTVTVSTSFPSRTPCDQAARRRRRGDHTCTKVGTFRNRGRNRQVAACGDVGEKVRTSHEDPFGNTIRLTGTGTIAKDNPFRFSTKRVEDNTGLVLYEYRAYSPTLGRWPNRDPIVAKGSPNPYAYVDNDPVSRAEIFGLIRFDLLVNCSKRLLGGALREVMTVNSACAAAAVQVGLSGGEKDLCDGFTFYPTTVPPYQPQSLGDQLLACLAESLGEKAVGVFLDESLDRVTRELLEEILTKPFPELDPPVVSGRVGVRAKCIGGRPKVFIFNELLVSDGTRSGYIDRNIVTEQFCPLTFEMAGGGSDCCICR